jgi:hypothetical protein
MMEHTRADFENMEDTTTTAGYIKSTEKILVGP